MPTTAVLRKPILRYTCWLRAAETGQLSVITESTNPAAMGASPRTACAYVGTNTVGATIRRPSAPSARLTAAMVRRRQTQPGMIGSAARRSMATTAPISATPVPNMAIDGTESQSQATPPCTSAVRSTPPHANTASAAGPVDTGARPLLPYGFVEMAHDEPEGDHADGHVDQEDPAPARVRGEQPAESRARDGRGRPHRRQPGLDAGAFLERVEVGGEGLDGALDGAAAQALDDTEGDERAHVPGARAQDRSDEEEDAAADQDGLAAEGVGQLPVDRQRDGDGEQVAREEPGEDGEAAEVADDLRDRRGDDGGVECRQCHGEHQRRDDRAPAPVRSRARLRCRAAHRIPSPCIYLAPDTFSPDPAAAGGWSTDAREGGANP